MKNRWLLFAALVAAGFVAGVGVGRYAGRLKALVIKPEVAPVDPERLFAKDGGFWQLRRDADQIAQQKALEELQSLSYVTGSQAPSQHTGVTVNDSSRTAAGNNLYSSAHAPQAFLIDANGNVIHEWHKSRNEVWPQLAEFDLGKARRYFRFVRLLPNGDLLVLYEYTGIIKLDSQSRLLWSHQGWNHHDLDIDEDGNIYVLGRDVDEEGRLSLEPVHHPFVPRRVAGKWIYDENISVLSPEGDLLDKISVVDCIQSSPYASMLDVVRHFDSDKPIDLLHPNTVCILDGNCAHLSPVFKKGNILTSFRNISTVAVIDPAEQQVVWAVSHAWRRQHLPVQLDNGHILLFDNFAGSLATDRHSRVVEFDPLTQQTAWSYAGTDRAPLFSSLMGAAARLPNGNTLITESDFGRAIEVAPDGEIVWEFNNPHTAGDQKQFVAIIPEVKRVPVDFVPEFR